MYVCGYIQNIHWYMNVCVYAHLIVPKTVVVVFRQGLYIPGWPGIHCVERVGLKIRDLHVSDSQP